MYYIKEKMFSLTGDTGVMSYIQSVAFVADSNIQRPVSMQWTNTDVINLSLSFGGSKGGCSAYVIGKTGTIEITGTVVLTQNNSDGTYSAVKLQ